MVGATTSPGLPLTTADAFHPRKYDWNPRHIRWGDVLRYQHWGGLLILIPAVVITVVSHWTFQERPVIRQALVYDATISYPTLNKQTIPNDLAALYNWICLIVAVFVIELLLFRKQHSLTVGITGAIHQLWCCLISFLVVIAIVEITKPFSGRLRPDFLARCQPAGLNNGGTAGSTQPYNSALGGNLAQATLGPVHLGQVAGDCTNPHHDTVKDGRLSFPSGHASNSMSVAWFTAIYVIWSMYLRHNAPYPGRLRKQYRHAKVGMMRYIFKRIAQEIWHALVYFFVLLALCLSWFIGITRFWDNVHNISDILGGFVVAIIFTTPFAIKAIGLHSCIRHLIDDAEPVAEGADPKPDVGTGARTVHTVPAGTVQQRVAPVGVHHGGVNGGLGQAGGVKMEQQPGPGEHLALHMAQAPAGMQG